MGQHEVALQEVMEALRNLSSNVTQIGGRLDQLSTHLTTPTAPIHIPAPAPAPALAPPPPALPISHSAHSREPFIPTPVRYSGVLGSCRQFLHQCNLVFDQQPLTYSSDQSRTAFVRSLLSERAAAWSVAISHSNSPICDSFQSFSAEFLRVFDHPLRSKEASSQLLSLRQGQNSVATHSIDFRILAIESGWDERALQGVFLRGLREELRDELAARDETTSLDELISLAIRLDNRLRERRRERSERERHTPPVRQTMSSHHRDPPDSSLPPSPPPPRDSSMDNLFSSLRRGAHAAGADEAHSYGTPAASSPEALHVLWTGGSSERSLPCFAKRGGSSATGGALVSHSSIMLSPPRLLVKGTVSWSQVSLPLSVLVDSGADDNFTDSDFIIQSNIPSEPLPQPKEVFALDGRLLARVTHRTVPVSLLLSGNHHETISLYIIPSPTSPLVLGLPWLKLHNPHIDWSTSSITNWSLFCHSHCLHSAIPASGATTQSPPKPVDLPSAYHHLQEVFSKDRALSLPPHRPYDCCINLLSGAPYPSSKLYNLSKPERDAMEAYITDSLKTGLIRPSSSPMGAGFFFVAKKDNSLRPCIDYRGLNDITIKNKYPLPLIDSAFGPLHEATIFSKLDLRNAYHLVRVKEGDEWKTGFNTPLGHFECLVMPFGLTNAPAVFQALINDVLRDMLNRFVFVYLDDIFIFSRNIQEHVQHVSLVLKRLLENKLYAKAEKCSFHVASVSFLGFIVEKGQIKTDPAKVQAVAEWPTPTSRKQLQRFLGFANFYRRFIRDYSKVATPLTRLTSVKIPFGWSPADFVTGLPPSEGLLQGGTFHPPVEAAIRPRDGHSSGPACVPSPWHPGRHCVGQGSAVLRPCVEGLLPGVGGLGQPVVWIPPAN